MSVTDKPLGTRARPRVGPAALLAVAVLCLLLLIVLPVQLGGWLFLGGLALIAIVIEPSIAVYALPFSVAFGSLAPLNVHGLNASPTDLLVAGLVLGFLTRCWPHAVLPSGSPVKLWPQELVGRLRIAWQRDRLCVAVFAALLSYLAVIVLSGADAASRTAVLKETLKWSEVVIVAALGLWQLVDAHRVRIVAWTFIAAALAEALLGFVQWIVAAGDTGAGGAGLRVFGTFAQPNPYAAYLNFAIPLAIALACFGHDVRERWVAGGAGCILLSASALADSRGALLGLAAAMVVIAVVGLRRERTAMLIAVVGVPLLLVAWFTDLIPSRIQTSLLNSFRISGASVCGQVDSRNFSTVERLAHWLAGLRMFQAHPVLGVGAGNYDAAYAQYACADWPESLGHAHNYYINAAAETGLLGLLAFIAVTCVALYLGWRVAKQLLVHRTPSVSATAGGTYLYAGALALGFLGVLTALVIHNLTDDLFVHGMELQVALTLASLLRLFVVSKRPI